MIEAYEIGVSVALRDGVSDGIALMKHDMRAVEQSVRTSAASMSRLHAAARQVMAPSPELAALRLLSRENRTDRRPPMLKPPEVAEVPGLTAPVSGRDNLAPRRTDTAPHYSAAPVRPFIDTPPVGPGSYVASVPTVETMATASPPTFETAANPAIAAIERPMSVQSSMRADLPGTPPMVFHIPSAAAGHAPMPDPPYAAETRPLPPWPAALAPKGEFSSPISAVGAPTAKQHEPRPAELLDPLPEMAAAVVHFMPPMAPAAPIAVNRPASLGNTSQLVEPPTASSDKRSHEGELYLDGTAVGRWVGALLTRSAQRAAVGPTGFDGRRWPILPGAVVGR